jgi:HK97 family phage major capsid protein
VLFIPFNEGAQADLPRPAGPTSIGKLLGADVYISEKMANLGTLGDVMLVDASKYLVGERQDAQVEATGIPYFTTNQSVIRCISRKDGQPWLAGPVTLADGTYTASSFVILD